MSLFPLFDRPRREPIMPPSSNSTTSKEAAKEIEPHVPNLREIVYMIYSRPEGATDDEVCIVTGIGGSTLRPRRAELLATIDRNGNPIEPRVRDSGETRPTMSGRQAIVWRATK